NNARAVRTALTVEMWDAINGAWLELKRYGNGPTSREEFSRFLRWVQETSMLIDGAAYRTMLRNDAYWFSRVGLYIERADNTARILDVKYHLLLPAEQHVGGPLDYFQWTAILRSVSALTAYNWVYHDSLKPWLIADLLTLNKELPRALDPDPARKQQHGTDFSARTARIHQRVHRGEQSPGRRRHRTIPHLNRA